MQKPSRSWSTATSLLLSLCTVLCPALADDGKRQSVGTSRAHASVPWAEGIVEDVSLENQWVILKHGPIANLHMEPMTMAFVVKDTSALSKMKVGDKILFKAILEGDDAAIIATKRAGK